MADDDFATLSPAVIRERIDATGLNMRARARALQDGVYAYLRTAIVTGALVRGNRVPAERTLVVAFGASRKSIRDALGRLERDGFLTRRVGSGSYVRWAPEAPSERWQFATPTVSPLDAIEARRVIEPNTCDLVVARATEDDFLRMRARLREMEAARDQVAFKEAGYAFHLEVARATRNPLLVAIYEMLVAARAKAGWGTLIPLNDRKEQRDEQIAANRAIYEALRARDVEQARRFSYRHLTEMINTVASFPLNA
jgi:DNA-binding FadR family transcriptional regulator